MIIQVGDAIGVWPTLALLLLDGFLGAASPAPRAGSPGGASTRRSPPGASRPRRSTTAPRSSFGGALLLSPGFITDIFGFLLLIPPTRALLRRSLLGVARRVGPTRSVFFLYDRRPGRAGRRRAAGRGPARNRRRVDRAPDPGPDPRGPTTSTAAPARSPTTRRELDPGTARPPRRRAEADADVLVHRRRARLLRAARGTRGRRGAANRRRGDRPRRGRRPDRRGPGDAAVRIRCRSRSRGARPGRCSSSRSTPRCVSLYGIAASGTQGGDDRWPGPGSPGSCPTAATRRCARSGRSAPKSDLLVLIVAAARGRARPRRGAGRGGADHGPAPSPTVTSSRCSPPSTTSTGLHTRATLELWAEDDGRSPSAAPAAASPGARLDAARPARGGPLRLEAGRRRRRSAATRSSRPELRRRPFGRIRRPCRSAPSSATSAACSPRRCSAPSPPSRTTPGVTLEQLGTRDGRRRRPARRRAPAVRARVRADQRGALPRHPPRRARADHRPPAAAASLQGDVLRRPAPERGDDRPDGRARRRAATGWRC